MCTGVLFTFYKANETSVSINFKVQVFNHKLFIQFSKLILFLRKCTFRKYLTKLFRLKITFRLQNKKSLNLLVVKVTKSCSYDKKVFQIPNFKRFFSVFDYKSPESVIKYVLRKHKLSRNIFGQMYAFNIYRCYRNSYKLMLFHSSNRPNTKY